MKVELLVIRHKAVRRAVPELLVAACVEMATAVKRLAVAGGAQTTHETWQASVAQADVAPSMATDT